MKGMPMDEEQAPPPPAAPRALELVEMVLKSPSSLDALVRAPALAGDLVPRLLLIALSGFSLYGLAVGLILGLSDARLPLVPPVRLGDGSALWLFLAYDLGLLAACGICLPSFYFYGLLAGIRTSMLEVTLHALKSLTVTAVVLVGVLPIYVALALGLVTFGAGELWLREVLFLGLVLPFLAGLWGLRSLYLGFLSLCDTMPAARRRARECFLRRLIFSWAGLYTVVTPVMIYTLWHRLAA